MTQEKRDWQEDQDLMGDVEKRGQRGAAELLKKGAAAASQFMDNLQIPSATTETVVGVILGCLTVRAFTKAWPRLGTPVSAAGYLVGGYAAYRLVKAAFRSAGGRSKSPTRRLCGVWSRLSSSGYYKGHGGSISTWSEDRITAV